MGIEPTGARLATERFTLKQHLRWTLAGSNRRPSRCHRDTLPAELKALIGVEGVEPSESRTQSECTSNGAVPRNDDGQVLRPWRASVGLEPDSVTTKLRPIVTRPAGIEPSFIRSTIGPPSNGVRSQESGTSWSRTRFFGSSGRRYDRTSTRPRGRRACAHRDPTGREGIEPSSRVLEARSPPWLRPRSSASWTRTRDFSINSRTLFQLS